jgi:polyisoprenoid-binding protein YceI
VTTAVLDIRIQAASVNRKRRKERQAERPGFFRRQIQSINTFLSNKAVQTGPDTFKMDGDFTIRGVTKPERLMLNKGIPFNKVADRVEVTVNLKALQVSPTGL